MNALRSHDVSGTCEREIPMRTLAILMLLLLAMVALPGAARAAESYDGCAGTVSALPATISTPGTWCLKQNLSTSMASGSAITIAANDVALDCNDFGIDGSAAGVSTLATGISASNTFHSTVRHCRVSGFQTAIELSVSGTGGGHLVEYNHLISNVLIGIDVEGDGSRVQHNDVLTTGSSAGAAGDLFGIRTAGSVDVLDNTVAGLVATTNQNGSVTGIYANFTGMSSGTGTSSGSVDGNRVKDLFSTVNGTTKAINVPSASGRGAIRNNDLSGDGTSRSTGISCASTRYRASYNVINGFPTFLPGCGDAGHNDKF
jgi:hypothetical protein